MSSSVGGARGKGAEVLAEGSGTRTGFFTSGFKSFSLLELLESITFDTSFGSRVSFNESFDNMEITEMELLGVVNEGSLVVL